MTIKLAVIAPPHDLQWGISGDIEFWQAEWVLSNPKAMPARRVKRFTIVDNQHVSADLKPHSVSSIAMLISAADALEANEVVLPDVLGNADATLNNLILYCSHPNLYRYRKMFVPQGKGPMDWVECLREGVQSCGEKFQTVGVPKSLEQFGEDTRIALIKYIPEQYDVHMLGIYKSVDEMTSYLGLLRVRSWDTSLPIAAAQVPISIRLKEKHELTDKPVSVAHAVANIKYLQQRLK
jgi:hypothetical protein